MAKTKSAPKGLPEYSLSNDTALDLAKRISEAHNNVATFEVEEKKIKEEISILCKATRETEANTDNIVGLIRIVPKEGSPTLCEFRTSGNGSFSVTQEKDLDNMYGPSKSLLFDRVKIISAILDPKQVIADLGPEAWDYLDLRIKEGQDEIVISKTTAVSYEEAFFPKKDILNTLRDIIHTLTDNAKVFTRNLLTRELTPYIKVGGKGTSKA